VELQGSLAGESHHLQHAERTADERLAAEGEQAPACPGETRLKDERAGPVEAALDGVIKGPLAERLARCETLSPFTAQGKPYGFFIHLLSKQLVIRSYVQNRASDSPISSVSSKTFPIEFPRDSMTPGSPEDEYVFARHSPINRAIIWRNGSSSLCISRHCNYGFITTDNRDTGDTSSRQAISCRSLLSRKSQNF